MAYDHWLSRLFIFPIFQIFLSIARFGSIFRENIYSGMLIKKNCIERFRVGRGREAGGT